MNTSNAWIYGLITIFGLGITYIIVTEVAVIGVVFPIFTNMVNGSIGGMVPIDAGTQTIILNNYSQIKTFLRALPFIIFFVTIIYMLVVSIRKEGESYIQ